MGATVRRRPSSFALKTYPASPLTSITAPAWVTNPREKRAADLRACSASQRILEAGERPRPASSSPDRLRRMNGWWTGSRGRATTRPPLRPRLTEADASLSCGEAYGARFSDLAKLGTSLQPLPPPLPTELRPRSGTTLRPCDWGKRAGLLGPEPASATDERPPPFSSTAAHFVPYDPSRGAERKARRPVQQCRRAAH